MSSGRAQTGIEAELAEAALVAVPDGLAERVLRARRRRSARRHAGVSAIALAAVLSILAVSRLLDPGMLAGPVEAVGPDHPAVAAISVVADDRTELAQSGNAAEMEQRLNALGLKLERRGVVASYAGKCHLSGADCDLILLDTPEARANVILFPDYPLAAPVLVADRRMVALAEPAGAGAYVVVADSPKVAKRMQRLFRRNS